MQYFLIYESENYRTNFRMIKTTNNNNAYAIDNHSITKPNTLRLNELKSYFKLKQKFWGGINNI